MGLIEDISIAVSGLLANKMRAILTMLGIIIGIAAVVAITTIGDSLVVSMNRDMADMVQNKIEVGVIHKNSDDMYTSRDEDGSSNISDEMISSYKDFFNDRISAVILSQLVGNGKVTENRKTASVSVSGVNEGYKIGEKIKMSQGRFIEERDVLSTKNVVVVSEKFLQNIYPKGYDILGKEVQVSMNEDIYTFTVIGVYKQKEASAGLFSFGGDYDSTNFYIPTTVARQITNANQGYRWITIVGKEKEDLKVLSNDTQKFFDKAYKNDTKYGCMVQNLNSFMEQGTSMLKKVSVFIAVIAAISLLVGGIGVMNIMIVSITERTREIGTRKALGAPNSSIQRQFIVESVIICLIGGAIGILLGGTVGVIGSNIMKSPVFPSIKSILMAFGFSTAIGVFFGYYPASKAAKMNPIDALRYE